MKWNANPSGWSWTQTVGKFFSASQSSAPSIAKVILLCCAFEVYHALKIGLRETVEIALATRRFTEIYRVCHKLILDNFQASQGHLTGIIPPPTCPTESADFTLRLSHLHICIYIYIYKSPEHIKTCTGLRP